MLDDGSPVLRRKPLQHQLLPLPGVAERAWWLAPSPATTLRQTVARHCHRTIVWPPERRGTARGESTGRRWPTSCTARLVNWFGKLQVALLRSWNTPCRSLVGLLRVAARAPPGSVTQFGRTVCRVDWSAYLATLRCMSITFRKLRVRTPRGRSLWYNIAGRPGLRTSARDAGSARSLSPRNDA